MVRSRVLTLQERLTLTMLLAVATSAAGTKLVDQIHVIACLTQERSEPLALGWLLELAVLHLFPVPYRDHDFLTASELFLELSYHLRLRTLPPDEGQHLHATEGVVLVERRETHVHLVFLRYIRLEGRKVGRLLVVRAQFYLPLACFDGELNSELVRFLYVFKQGTLALEAFKKPTLHLVAFWRQKLFSHCEPVRETIMQEDNNDVKVELPLDSDDIIAMKQRVRE